MASLVEIYNRALGEISARSTVASPDEPSVEARNCNRYFPSVRDQVFRAANWSFARKTATLALLKAAAGTPENPEPSTSDVWTTNYPPPPWLYSYAYPSDCARMQFMQPQFNTLAGLTPPLFPVTLSNYPLADTQWGVFQVANDQDEGQNDFTVILTNVSQSIGVYTRRITETSIWDASFTEAVVFGLAGRLAPAISGDKRMMQMMFQMANGFLVEARRNDANEGLTIQDHVPDWMSVRGMTWRPGSRGPWVAPYGPMFGVV